MSVHSQVVDILSKAKEDIAAVLGEPEHEHHRLKVTTSLQREIDYVSLVTKTGDVTATKRERLGPAKTIGGKPIEVSKPRRTTPADLEPETGKVSELRKKVEEAWPLFLTEAPSALIRDLEDIVIRGVAKKAHMKVTKDEPKKLSVSFVTQVKKKVKEVEEGKAELTSEIESDFEEIEE